MSIKNTSPFTMDDYNSGDGMMTSIWGPPMWHTLHTISFNYPVNPTDKQKKDYFIFYRNLKNILPCKYCRDNLAINMKNHKLTLKTMESRDSLSRWVYELHEIVNKLLKKKSNLSFEEVRDRFEHFRSHCLVDPKKDVKKESGCTEPLYGIKSKCILNIVPKNKSCNTFTIDKKCSIKKKKK
jgi:hypothetical protein